MVVYQVFPTLIGYKSIISQVPAARGIVCYPCRGPIVYELGKSYIHTAVFITGFGERGPRAHSILEMGAMSEL